MNIFSTFKRGLGIAKILAVRYAPDILTIGGLGLEIGACVATHSAALRAEKILADKEMKKAAIEAAKLEEEYTEEDEKHDLMVVKGQTIREMGKNYLLPVGLGTAGILAVLKGFGIMKGRYLGAVGAFEGLAAIFGKYRERVVEDQGESADLKYRYGLTEKKVTVKRTDENGNEVKEKVSVLIPPEGEDMKEKFRDDIVTRWWGDEYTRNYTGLKHDIPWLQSREQWFTNMLKTEGAVVLNDVLDCLGYEKTNEGMVLGWKYDKEMCNHITFGLLNPCNKGSFNNDSDDLLLDFSEGLTLLYGNVKEFGLGPDLFLPKALRRNANGYFG